MSADQWFRLLAFLLIATGVVLAVWWDHNHAVPFHDTSEED